LISAGTSRSSPRSLPGRSWRTVLFRWQQRAAPYLFVSPFVVLFVLFLLYPLGRSLSLSFERVVGEGGPSLWRYVGTANYRFLLHDPLFWLACLNTALYAVMLLVLELPLSLGLALLLNSRRVRGRAFFRFAFFAPFLVGQVFLAMLAYLMLAPRQGLVNQFIALLLPKIGNESNWRGNPMLAMPAVVLASLWVSIGFAMILWLSALQAVDPQLYEAAAVDGAGRWGRFVHVTLPGIRPMFVFLLIVGTISALSLFELPYVFFQGPGPGFAGLTVVMYLYEFGFQTGDLGTASAVGWVLAGLIFVITVAQIRLTSGGREARESRA
jgi:ABC-type sugar transport system permease subunit